MNKSIKRVLKEVFSIKRRKRIAVSDIFLNFAFAILIGGVDDYIVGSPYICNKV